MSRTGTHRMKPLEFYRFDTKCDKCGNRLLVEPPDREAGLRCAACGWRNGPWPIVPDQEVLPRDEATLRDIVRFSNLFNPIPFFHKKWGDAYATQASELWLHCVKAFKDKSSPTTDMGELLMCLQYDIVLGPALGVPDPHKLEFLRWVVKGIRDTVEKA